jgi:hypothetical protein
MSVAIVNEALTLAADLVEIDAKIKDAKRVVDELADVRAALEEQLLEQFGEAGVSSVKVNGRTVGMRRDVFAKILDPERLHDALRAAGFGDLIQPKVDSQKLSALVREFDRGEVECPADLAEVVTASEKFSIRVTAR